MQGVFLEDKWYRSRPELFLCGHPREKCGYISPVHALPFPGKNAILRNINRQNILIQNNPGFIWTIAHFVMERFDYPLLSGSSHFAVKKWMVYTDSMRENPIATKIFINWQIEKKYNPFR
jgi:hypothetical protein